MTDRQEEVAERRRAEDSRLSRLEAIVENLAREVGDLKDIVIAGGRTNWSVLASWAAVILAVISIIGSGYVADLTRLEKKSEREHHENLELRIEVARLDERLKIFEEERKYKHKAEAERDVKALHSK